MSPEKNRNTSHSIFRRLLNYARSNKEDFNLLLFRYGIERLLYRLSISPHADSFILKGASLFLVWKGQNYRVTKDADLLGMGPSDAERIKGAGEPWPTDATRAALGEGVYAWDNLGDAEAYLSTLGGDDLEVVAFQVDMSLLQNQGQLSVDSLGTPGADAWMERYSSLWGGTPDHGLQYITRNTAMGTEHYFSKSIIQLLQFPK